VTASVNQVDLACDHCGLPVPRGLIDKATEHQFCCAGCRAVWGALHEAGLDRYYALREAAGGEGRQVEAAEGLAAFDDHAFLAEHVRPLPDGRATSAFLLEGVTCAACVWLVEKLPRLCPGVIEARLDLHQQTARVTWKTADISCGRVAAGLAKLGYTPHPPRPADRAELAKREDRRRLIDIAVAGVCAGNIMLLAFALYGGELAAAGDLEHRFWSLFRWLSTGFGLASLAWPGRVFFKGAVAALRVRSVSLDVPIALALLAGGAAGLVNVVLGRGDIYFDSLAVLVFLLLVGRFIQHRQQRRAADTVRLLNALVPSISRLVESGRVREVPTSSLNSGQVVEVLPGGIVPGDGRVREAAGGTRFDQSMLTGESDPVAAGVGDAAWAGARNLERRCVIELSAVGEASRVGQMMAGVERALAERPRAVQLADRIAGYFTVAMIALATAVAVGWSILETPAIGIDHAVALLIVACPCAMGLATPLTMAVSLARLARRQVLVKSAAALEKLAGGGRLVLDKTGTLTEGRATLARWHGDDTLRPLVALVEQHSGHHLARAVVQAWGDLEADAEARRAVVENGVTDLGDGGLTTEFGRGTLRVGSPRWIAGHGVDIAKLQGELDSFAADGLTPVVAALGEKRLVIGFGDTVRPDAGATLGKLRRAGWQLQVLSGDTPAVAERVGESLGIHRIRGGVTPEEKADHVRQLAAGESAVAMVGDGVNDAEALAAADVGIAVAGGAEASLLAADVYVARPGLAPLVDLVAEARRCRWKVRRNLSVSLSYNALFVTLAAAGLITPLVAAIVMPISSFTVVMLALSGGGRKLP
jgi:Cu2+-exporting ATPase